MNRMSIVASPQKQSSANHVLHEIPPGGKDGNTLECVQIDEVAVTRDQAIGFAGMGGIEKFVVFRVPAHMHEATRADQLGSAQQDDGGAFARFGGNLAVEFFAGRHSKQFVPRGGRENQRGRAREQLQHPAGNRLRQEDAADDRVGINDKPFTGRHRSCA